MEILYLLIDDFIGHVMRLINIHFFYLRIHDKGLISS